VASRATYLQQQAAGRTHCTGHWDRHAMKWRLAWTADRASLTFSACTFAAIRCMCEGSLCFPRPLVLRPSFRPPRPPWPSSCA
jgi:hypothetical protein